jgi:hypothetical protein
MATGIALQMPPGAWTLLKGTVISSFFLDSIWFGQVVAFGLVAIPTVKELSRAAAGQPPFSSSAATTLPVFPVAPITIILDLIMIVSL